jgi:hypothetical protein
VSGQVTISTAQDSSQVTATHEQSQSGFGSSFSAGVASIGFGSAAASSQSSAESLLHQGSSIVSANGNTRIQAAQALSVEGSSIGAGQNLTLIGASVDLAAVQDISIEHNAQQSSSSGFSVGTTFNPLSAFKSAFQQSASGNASTSVLGKSTKYADAFSDGAQAATTAAVIQAGSRSASTSADYASSTAQVSALSAGNNLTILATGGSINSQGSNMTSEGSASLIAKDSINLDVAHNYETQSSSSVASGWSLDTRSAMAAGMFNNKSNGSSDTVSGTSISSGGSATLATTTGDITLTAANLVASQDVNISAANKLTIQSSQDTVNNANQSNNQAIGKVVISDTERFSGYHTENSQNTGNTVTQVASNVGSLQGNVSLTAGGAYTQTASNVLAANDISILAQSITVNTANDSGGSDQSSDSLKIGGFARVSSPLIDLANNVANAAKSDDRLQAMQSMAAAANGYQAYSALSGKSGSIAKAEVGVGFATSNSADHTSYVQAQGSTIQGGGNVSLTSTAGDIQASGAQIILQDSGSASSTTYATLTEGKITIGGKSTSAASLGAHTDLTTANSSIEALPDVKKLMQDQQAMAAAANTVIATAVQFTNDKAQAAKNQADQESENVGKADDAVASAQKNLDAVLANQESSEAEKSRAQEDLNTATQERESAQQALNTSQESARNWGPTGDYTRALNVITGVLVGGVAGQSVGQLAANASAPYLANAIGDYFSQPGNENKSAQVLSHAVLGGLLAAANGGSAVGGALSGGGGELAAQAITKELYPKAYDADGSFHPERLSTSETNTVIALSSAVGAMLGGITGGMTQDALVGANVAANAVVNNLLKHPQFDVFKSRYAKCTTAQCKTDVLTEMKALSDAQDALLKTCTTEESCKALASDVVFPMKQNGVLGIEWRKGSGFLGFGSATSTDFYNFCASGDSACLTTLDYITNHSNGASITNVSAAYTAFENSQQALMESGAKELQDRYNLSPETAMLWAGILAQGMTGQGAAGLGAKVGSKTSVGVVGANGATAASTASPIPANSVNAGVGLRNDLSIQAGVPTSTSNVWGSSIGDLNQAFSTGGATVTQGSARASSSRNAQILNVDGSNTGVVQVQYSPASTQSSHGGQYYKFTYADGSELKIIDPATYRVLGWPENGGNTTFTNPSGTVITYDPVSKTWR